MPRRNPQAQPATDAAPAIHVEPPAYEEDAIPHNAAPGDVVLRDGRPIGTVGLDGRGNVRVILNSDERRRIALQDATTEANRIDALRAALSSEGPRVAVWHHDGAVTHERLTPPLATDVGNSVHEGMEQMLRPTQAPDVAAAADSLPSVVGPRMIAAALLGGAGDIYRRHTADLQAAMGRAHAHYFTRGGYQQITVRARQEAPTTATAQRNLTHVESFLTDGYGIELNEEALRAVTAMVTTLARQTAVPLIEERDRAQTNAANERTATQALRANVASLDREVVTMTAARDSLQEAIRDADTDAQHTGRIINGTITTTTDPGPVEAAVAAAKAWKQTGAGDSVAKLASFKHLLDTLDRLAL